ncbi:LysR family transcriptional regulator [Asaia bogorensis]|uniref:LysR family transcriptional regulator n=1 Tax=Asaia bogorensis TaxID=91915 RepID=UPI0028573ED0|nr:LysR family transcriptional regulator [Asaia bogorensis]MDR6184022.1 DNA-binding transcriptional LysR family regulator [Asaia bogorensis NBRC 16594]
MKSNILCAGIHGMDTSRLDFNLLVTLDTLLAERNVTRAARRLNMSQPALSTRLSRLRDIFDDPLLIPKQRGMVPTQKALELQPRLHEALEAVRQVVATDTAFDPSRAKGIIRVAASDYTQSALLLPLVHILRREAPGLRIAWLNLDLTALHSQMERGVVDLAIDLPQVEPGQLRMRAFCREEYVLIARNGHPHIKSTIDLDLFCCLDHIIVSPDGGGFAGPTDTVLEAMGRSRRVVLSTPGFLIVPRIVANSDMIAVVPARIVREERGRLQVLNPPISVPGFELALLWHDRTTTHPVQRWVRERLTLLVRNI